MQETFSCRGLSYILILTGSFLLESCFCPLRNLRKTCHFYKGAMKLLQQVLGKQGPVCRAPGGEQTSCERQLSPWAGQLDPKGISRKILSLAFTPLSQQM